MTNRLKMQPTYTVSSVDHALQIATILQLQGPITVSEAAQRLGIARSTAHRLLGMLVYRDFAVQDENRSYRVGPVLELAAHSHSEVSRVRAAAMPHLRRLVDFVDESANVIIRTGDSARFIASLECRQALRVGNREGMVFPAYRVSGGLVLLAELSGEQLESLFAESRFADRLHDRPEMSRLRSELAVIKKQGFAVNRGRAEKGVVGIGCPVRRPDGSVVAGVSVSVPSVRYGPKQLLPLVGAIRLATHAIESELAQA